MEYTDYMGLPDDIFFVEVFKFYKGRNKEGFQFLKDRPFIMDRFKSLISKNYIKGDKKHTCLNFIKCYESYVALSNVYDVVSDPLKYYDKERIRVFSSYDFLSGDLRGLRLFPDEEKQRISHVISGYDISKKINEKNTATKKYESKYENIILFLKSVLRAYSKYGDSNKFYSFLFDGIKVNQSSFNNIIKYTKIFFCQNLCLGSNLIEKDILSELTFDEICLLEKIGKDYFDIFESYNFKVEEVCTSIDDYVKLFKLFDQINTSLSRRKALEYTVGYISNDLGISLRDIENYYYSIFKSYCFLKFNDFDCDSSLKKFIDNRKFKFSDISNFSDVMIMYRELVHRSSHLIKLLCSDRRNMNNLINIIYEVKFLNGINPSVNQYCLEGRIRGLNDSIRTKCNKFIVGYKEYYDSKKEFLEDEKKQGITDNEVNNLDLYVTHVKLFLDSGCESIDDYFGEDVDDKEAFIFALGALKRYDHPIYQRYIDFVASISDENHNRMVGDCKEIVRLINEGVLKSDGSVREFDLVDFYLYTDLNKQRFMNVIRDNVSSEEYASVSRFFSKYKGERVLEGNMIDQLYLNKVSFPNGWDSEGNVISYYDVTKEDKMNAIITIGKMGIPLTSITYGIVLRKSVEEIINEKKLTKRKKRV